MNIKNKTEHNVVLSEDVVAKMASVAAMEVEGVCEVVPNPNIKKMFAPKTSRAVNVRFSQDSMIIDLYIKLKVGVNITSLCESVQETVKKTVQNMTGCAVSRVNVIVADIDIPVEE